MEHPLKLETDPVDPDQSSGASGTAVLVEHRHKNDPEICLHNFNPPRRGQQNGAVRLRQNRSAKGNSSRH